jgi:hypothetical protein
MNKDQLVAETSTYTTQETNIHALIGILTRDPTQKVTADPCLRPHGHRDRCLLHYQVCFRGRKLLNFTAQFSRSCHGCAVDLYIVKVRIGINQHKQKSNGLDIKYRLPSFIQICLVVLKIKHRNRMLTRSIILMDFFHRLKTKFKRFSSSQPLVQWLGLAQSIGPNGLGLPPPHPKIFTWWRRQSQPSKRCDFNLLTFVLRLWKKSIRMILLIITHRQNLLVCSLLASFIRWVERTHGTKVEKMWRTPRSHVYMYVKHTLHGLQKFSTTRNIQHWLYEYANDANQFRKGTYLR